MNSDLARLTAIIFDWAGTTVDHGSRAPALVFQEIFHRRGIDITAAQARGPMGMAKRDHIAAIAGLPGVAKAWAVVHGQPCQDSDIDALYEEFLPLQKSILSQYSDVIAGVPQAVAACRRLGLKIGSATGYTRELMKTVADVAASQGYAPDCVICAEDARRGRPAPYVLYEAAQRLDVYPLWTVVAVDDTSVGIQSSRNAGCWTVGVTRTGNGVGLSAEEIAALPRDQVARLCAEAAKPLRAAGAHYIIESVSEIEGILADVERRLRQGETPLAPTAMSS